MYSPQSQTAQGGPESAIAPDGRNNLPNFKSITISKDSITEDVFERLVQESISSLYATDLAFDSIPSMKFDETGCNWNSIVKNEIFGPFAPRSGWIPGARKDVRNSLPSERRNAFFETLPSASPGKEMLKSMMAKSLKKRNTTKYAMPPVEDPGSDRKQLALVRLGRKKRNLLYGRVCDVYISGKLKQGSRRASDLGIELKPLLDFGSGLRTIPRCRSCNCSACKRKKAGMEYIFDLPKPFELNKRRVELEAKLRRNKSLADRSGPKRCGNRYGNLMSPLITAQSRITELRKKQEAQAPPVVLATNETDGTPLIEGLENLTLKEGSRKLDFLSPDNNSKKIVDLVRSPMQKRRATLKLALTDATSLHSKLSAFAAGLPEKKGPPESSSDESTPTDRPRVRKNSILAMLPTWNKEQKSKPKPKPKRETIDFQRASKVKLNLCKLDDQIPGDAIKESPAESSPKRKPNSFVKSQKSMNVATCTALHEYTKNRALTLYLDSRLKLGMTLASPTTVRTLPSSAEQPANCRNMGRTVKTSAAKTVLPELERGGCKGYLTDTLPSKHKGKRKGKKNVSAFNKNIVIKSFSYAHQVYGMSASEAKVHL